MGMLVDSSRDGANVSDGSDELDGDILGSCDG